MRNRRVFLAGAAALLAPATAVAAGRVTVFAAASLQEALTAAGAAWTAASGIAVRFSFGASSAMARQIDQGAPADVFLSADKDWMDWLAGRRRIVRASRRDLLTNRLALIAPTRSTTSLKIAPRMDLARALAGGRLALADPVSVPAGRYARAALTALGAWDAVDGRLLPAESVRAALAYVSRGEASLGIVYVTDARAESKVRVVDIFPASSHPPILYPGAVVAASRNRDAAAFLGFLQGPRATAIFKRHGFGVLARPA